MTHTILKIRLPVFLKEKLVKEKYLRRKENISLAAIVREIITKHYEKK